MMDQNRLAARTDAAVAWRGLDASDKPRQRLSVDLALERKTQHLEYGRANVEHIAALKPRPGRERTIQYPKRRMRGVIAGSRQPFCRRSV